MQMHEAFSGSEYPSQPAEPDDCSPEAQKRSAEDVAAVSEGPEGVGELRPKLQRLG